MVHPPYDTKHFYESESVLWGTMGDCALRLGEPDRALDTISKSLAIGNPADVHNRSFDLLGQTEAFIQKNEIAEASRITGEVAVRTASYTSARIDQRITELRSVLSPWQGSKPVRELDEILATYRRSPTRSYSL